MKIYVVDDVECIRDSFEMHLELLGHQVEKCEEPVFCDLYTGECCSKDTPCADLVLLDYRLPKIDGLELAQRIREQGCCELVTNIVIMTGDVTPIDPRDIDRVGCRLEQKPLTLRTLDRILQDAEELIELNRNRAKLSASEQQQSPRQTI